MKKRLSLLYFLAAISFWLPAGAQQLWSTEDLYPKREARAVWLTTVGGIDWPRAKATSEEGRARQKEELCRILDQLKACNINTILLQTRVRGDVIYPSKIEPWCVCLTGTYDRNPGYDPLAFAIEEAHKRGMELHAWMVTVPSFKVNVAKKMGEKCLLRTHPELLKKHIDTYYLDPGLPGTAEYIASICKEIAENYDIDGLHFDYIRYPEKAESFPDASTYSKYGNGKTKADWRRDNITHIVRTAYQTVKSVKPWVKMSCSPVGKFRDTRRYSSKGWNCFDAVYQDAQGWLREGIQDALYPMMYFTGDHFYPFILDWKEGSYGRPVAPGLGIYFLSPSEKNWNFDVVGRELHCIREVGLSGQCYFRSKYLTENTKGIYDYLQEVFYAYPALTPRCTWLDSIPPTQPSDCKVTELGPQMRELNWSASTDNLQQAGVRYNVYASLDYPVDISKAENLVASYLSETKYSYNKLFGMNIAITAIDRCGNESKALQTGGGVMPQSVSGEDAGKHYMKHDGSVLELPYNPDVEFYLITDLAGKEMQSGKWRRRIDVSRLQAGVYRLRTLQKRGVSRMVGEFKK